MALIPIASLRRQVLSIMDRIGPAAGVLLLSYKRDRRVAIVYLDQDRFRIREDGFVHREKVVSRAELPRLLKTVIRREFPRSRKVRLIRIDETAALDRSVVRN